MDHFTGRHAHFSWHSACFQSKFGHTQSRLKALAFSLFLVGFGQLLVGFWSAFGMFFIFSCLSVGFQFNLKTYRKSSECINNFQLAFGIFLGRTESWLNITRILAFKILIIIFMEYQHMIIIMYASQNKATQNPIKMTNSLFPFPLTPFPLLPDWLALPFTQLTNSLHSHPLPN